MSKTAGVL